jgi:hypothetical protein
MNIDAIISSAQAQVEAEFAQYKLDFAERAKLPPIPAGKWIRFHGRSMNQGRVGVIVEAPGPSKKYDGRDAERYEIWLDIRIGKNYTQEPTTIFADRGDLEQI